MSRRIPVLVALVLAFTSPVVGALVEKFDLVGEWVGTPAPGTTVRYVFKTNGEVVWIVEENSKAPVRTEAHYTLDEGTGLRSLDIHDFDARQMRGIRLLGIMEPLTPSTFKFDGVPSNKGQRPPTWTTNALVFTSTNTALSKAIASLTIGGVTYANVMVESANEKTVSFSHSRGMASVNPKKLTDGERRALGLNVVSLSQSIESESKAQAVEPVKKRNSNISSRISGWFASQSPEMTRRNLGAIALAIVFAVIGFYLFNCLCLLCICKKTDHPAPLLVWLPVFQVLAIYRAAGMSSFWFKALVFDLCFRITVAGWAIASSHPPLSPATNAVMVCTALAFTILHMIGWCIWCFKICIAREKSVWLGFLVLFPLTQPPALGYLAFSK
jgi:hypothetical protein